MSEEDLKKRIETAHYVASAAGSLITDLFHKTLKTDNELANNSADDLEKSIESMCLNNVQSLYADDGFYTEQHNGSSTKSGFTWIVDAINGATNFTRGLPLCGFQLAIMYNDELVYAVILRPFTQEWFTAQKSQGAFYKNRQTGEESILSVSARDLENSMIIFDASVGKPDNPSTQLLASLAEEIAAVRSFGVSVFDLPSVASGMAEVLITGIAEKSHIAAGTLLLTEAGGEVYDLEGEKPTLDDRLMIFSSKTLKQPLLKSIKSNL